MNVARKPADRQRIQAIEPVLAARIETDRHDQTLGRGDKAGAKRQRRLERDHGLAEPAPEPKSRHQHATNQSGKFKILDHLDKLTHHKGDKYICPVCGGNNLSIGPETGAYNCFSGCETQAIREAIAPWADRQSKATRNQPKRQWVYADADGSLLIRVNRTDDSQGEKRIWQEYQFNGVWVAKAKDVPASTKAQAKAAVMPYRYREAMQAASQGDLVYWVEGEKCADALWNIGIPATTSIGGSDGYKRYGDYSNVFVGVNLVIAPDRDIAGIKYADAIAHDYPQAKWLYAFPGSAEWDNLPKSGGLDVADWIASGADKEAIESALGKRRSSDQPVAKTKPKSAADVSSAADHETEVNWDRLTLHDHTLGRKKMREQGGGYVAEFTPLLTAELKMTLKLETVAEGGATELLATWKNGAIIRQKTIRLKVSDCNTPDKFSDALNKEVGEQIACYLTKKDLQTLMHQLSEDYHATGGRTYKLADRFGEQVDGYFVFEHIQYTPSGQTCTAQESGWVFDPHLGQEDGMNCPTILPECADALPNLVAAARNLYQPEALKFALCEMGNGTSTLHNTILRKTYNNISQSTIDGPPGVGKTIAARMSASPTGTHIPDLVMSSDTTASAVAERIKLYSSLQQVWDDPIPLGGDAKDIKAARKSVNATLTRLFNGFNRGKRGGGQAANTNVTVTSNAGAGGAAAAADERLISKNWPNLEVNVSSGEADRLERAMDAASGGVGQLLRIPFDRTKIDAYTVEFKKYMPNAHMRQARGLAIQCYYTEGFCEVAGVTDFDVFAFTRDVLCPQADATETAKSNLSDFLERLDNLRTGEHVGKWNATMVTRDGRSYLAIKQVDVWDILQKQQASNIPNYGLSALKSQITDQGGFADSTQRQKFVPTQQAWTDYLRAENQFNIINGEKSTASRPIPPKRSLSCACWLIPANAVKEALGRAWDDADSSGEVYPLEAEPTPSVTPEATETTFTPIEAEEIENCLTIAETAAAAASPEAVSTAWQMLRQLPDERLKKAVWRGLSVAARNAMQKAKESERLGTWESAA
jgi:hypothetical protein